MKKFRSHGAFGALIDEYEKAVIELQLVMKDISPEELIAIADSVTKDPDCKSIQTVLTHVVRAGYGYVTEIRKDLGEDVAFIDGVILDTIEDYHQALNDMFKYNVGLFEDHPEIQLEEYKNDNK